MPRGVPWLVAAIVLFLIGALVVSRDEDRAADDREKRRASLEFPRYAKEQDLERQQRRRTLPPLPAPPAAAGDEEASLEPAARPAARDPVLAALPADSESALVLEASVVRESPVGRMFLRCLAAERGDVFERIRSETGVDVLADVERVALANRGERGIAVVEGDLAGLAEKLPESDDLVARPWGERGVIRARAAADGGDPSRFAVASWGDRLLMVGDEPGLREAIDRLEGRTASAAPIPEHESYGEIYGRLSPELAAEMLRDFAEPLQTAVKNIAIHVDAREDVLLVADVDGPSAEPLSDLARSLGGALSAARLAARAQGEEDIAELLELARVEPHPGSFRIEAALPVDWVARRLGPCAGDGG